MARKVVMSMQRWVPPYHSSQFFLTPKKRKIKYPFYLINYNGNVELLLLSLDGCHVTGYPLHK